MVCLKLMNGADKHHPCCQTTLSLSLQSERNPFFAGQNATESRTTRPSGSSTDWRAWQAAFAAISETQHEASKVAVALERGVLRTRAASDTA